MFDGLGAWLENVIQTGAGAFSAYQQNKADTEIAREKLKTESLVSAANTKRMLYLGLGVLGAVLLSKMVKQF